MLEGGFGQAMDSCSLKWGGAQRVDIEGHTKQKANVKLKSGDACTLSKKTLGLYSRPDRFRPAYKVIDRHVHACLLSDSD